MLASETEKVNCEYIFKIRTGVWFLHQFNHLHSLLFILHDKWAYLDTVTTKFMFFLGGPRIQMDKPYTHLFWRHWLWRHNLRQADVAAGPSSRDYCFISLY